MRVAARVSSRLAYWLRLATATLACVRYIFQLLRQGGRNATVLIRCEEVIRGRRLALGTKSARLIAIPIRHFGALLRGLPDIAGSQAEHYRQRIQQVHEKVSGLSAEIPDGRSFLPTSSARRLQRLLVSEVFEKHLSISLDSEQAISFAVYAESSEVVLDFLDFCQRQDQMQSKACLLALLPFFEQLIRPYRWLKPEDDRFGPKRGELCKHPLPASTRIRLRAQWFRPTPILVRMYRCNLEPAQFFADLPLRRWASDLYEYFEALEKSPPSTVLEVLTCEMCKRACLDLAQLFSATVAFSGRT